MAWGAEPQDRERSPGARPGKPWPLGRLAAAQRKGGCSSEDHLGISLADFVLICSPAIAGKGCIGWG
jgi:hypothetical protein